MIDYEPQNLRYTDDVIATLQSGWPLEKIARALQVTIGEAEWHIAEVDGMPHRGEPIWPEPKATVPKYPTDPEWYAARTKEDAAKLWGVNAITALKYAGAIGMKFKRSPSKRGRGPKDYPTDPDWYQTRTAPEIAAELGLTTEGARILAARYGGPLRIYNYKCDYPTDPEWYKTRTYWEAAAELGASMQTVRNYAWRHKYEFKPSHEVVE